MIEHDSTDTTIANDPILVLLLRGEAETVAQAEEMYLDAHVRDVIRLAESALPDEEFRQHPLVALLLSHGSRGWEDSLA
jgi:hypothetical protein